MGKKRPYINKSIQELEFIFSQKGSDAGIFNALQHELGFRTTNRARNLKRRLQSAQAELPLKAEPKPAHTPRPESPPEPPTQDSDANTWSIESQPLPAKPAINIGPKPEVTNEPRNILRAWTALEVLSPQGYRRKTDLVGGDVSRIASIENDPLPWEKGEKSRPKKRLYYEVILGTINLGPAIEALLRVYSDARPDMPRTKSYGAIASVLLDKEGRPLEEPNSFAISSFAWGVPIALKGDLRTLADWPSAERSLIRSTERLLYRRDDKGDIRPLDRQAIRRLFDHLVSALDLAGMDIAPPDFALRRYEFFASKIPPEPSLLNSFFLEDLAATRELIPKPDAPRALAHYLGIERPAERFDLLDDRDALRRMLAPAETPLARWPGRGRHKLALLQQAAVNACKDGMPETGILSVNGPPGTGKTTLLRDVVAARIVERARAMVRYKNPIDAFEATGESAQRSGAKITLHRLDERLKGFEMVVASSNNKAVENVSAELPDLDAIAEDAPALRYFSSISDNLLERDTWGAIAAVLGNAGNRYQVSQAFWRDEERGLSTYLNHAAGVPQYAVEPQEGGPPLKRLRKVVERERPPENKKEARTRWNAAKAAFIEKCDVAHRSREDRQALHDKLMLICELRAEAKALVQTQGDLEATLEKLADKKSLVEALNAECRTILNESQDALARHQHHKPGWLIRLFRLREARAWNARNDTLSTTERSHAKSAQEAKASLSQIEAALGNTRQRLDETRERSKQVDGERHQAERKFATAREALAAPIPDDTFFDQDDQIVQTAHLWFDDECSRERDDLFEAAMAVHRAFIDCAADPIRQNFAIFIESFGTRSLGTPAKDKLIPDLWSTFFLVVPIISTTFASVHRMFSRVPPETLGWLLVDEAGQAVPQAVVGAMMRTKRVVVVGDPLQIEPVVMLPNTLTEEICGFFGIDAMRFNAPEASVQTLADAASPYCAKFPIGSGHREVGAPLLVHRRCDSPMFEISNTIAYSNLMVQAKPASSDRGPLGPSCWFDVTGPPGPDKWCDAEADCLIEKLEALKERGAKADLYVVTPFVIVQDNLRQRLRESGVLDGWVDNPSRWVNEHVGTVHTVQGREAKIVFFVLGAQAPSQTGARNWAGGRPNLVNVAVTRARSALYVIGNRELWKSAGVFKTLDQFIK